METKIKWFDSMRGLACLIVLIAHIIAINPMFGMYANGCGKIGVWLFLLMAAFFLLYHSEGQTFTKKDLVEYYWKKILRLYPVYIIGLLVAYCCELLPDWRNILKHLFLIEGIGHFWYMPVIIKFFIIAPVFKWVYTKLRNQAIFSVMIFVLAIVLAISFPFTKYTENSIELRWYMPVFLMGMLLYILYEKIQNHSSCKAWDVIAVAFVDVILLFTPWMREKLWGMEPSRYLQNKYLLIGGLWCLIILSISQGEYIRALLEKCTILQGIGKISYSIYIFHYIILQWLNGKNMSWGINVIVTISLSILISLIIRYGVEEPLERMQVVLGENRGK